MTRKCCIAMIILLLFSSNALAGFGSGFYSSRYSRESGTIVAVVEIKEKGIYNLVISVQFLRKPQDTKIYKSDEYKYLIDRLLVESQGIALKKVLECKKLEIIDFPGLSNSIKTEIEKLVGQLKKKVLPGQDVEVVFSISDFFLLEPKDK